MVRELELNTTVMGGNFDSFQAAFSRSVLGVTYKKFKRRGKDFYKHKTHNEEITKKSFEYLYLTLREYFKDSISKYNLRVNYIIEWDDYGKIIDFKNLTVNVYLPIGKLLIDNLKLQESEESIKIDFFYSDFDAGSKMVKSYLEKLEKEFEHEKLDISHHNIQDKNYPDVAKAFGVGLVPSIQIEQSKIENPNENQIRTAILKSLDKPIVAINSRFKDNEDKIIQLTNIVQK